MEGKKKALITVSVVVVFLVVVAIVTVVRSKNMNKFVQGIINSQEGMPLEEVVPIKDAYSLSELESVEVSDIVITPEESEDDITGTQWEAWTYMCKCVQAEFTSGSILGSKYTVVLSSSTMEKDGTAVWHLRSMSESNSDLTFYLNGLNEQCYVRVS